MLLIIRVVYMICSKLEIDYFIIGNYLIDLEIEALARDDPL